LFLSDVTVNLRSVFNLIGCVCLFLAGCATYKQNIMMVTPEGFQSAAISKEILQAERNYVIQKNDHLKLEIYRNKGEGIVDPNPDLSTPGGSDTNSQTQNKAPINYLVDLNGIVKFPMVGEMKMEGLTLRQAEAILQTEYEKFFTDSYVVLTFQNKRVIVLGATTGQVIPLMNQNVNLAEIIAMAKGIPTDGKAKNIRLVRGDKVFVIDMSTIEGFQAGNMIVEPGDIIYVEPVRKPFAEAFRDYAGVFSLIVSTLSLILVLSYK
jgi:polysaccharide biosynthesis/export protein